MPHSMNISTIIHNGIASHQYKLFTIIANSEAVSAATKTLPNSLNSSLLFILSVIPVDYPWTDAKRVIKHPFAKICKCP
jgi:hypothetical protein